jgi:hypothetical protein
MFTGILITGAKAYKPAFKVLRNISAAAHFNVSQFFYNLFITADFACTV